MKDKQDRLAISRGDMTVLELVEKYLEQKRNVRPTTSAGYKTVVNVLKRTGAMKIIGKNRVSYMIYAYGEWEI